MKKCLFVFLAFYAGYVVAEPTVIADGSTIYEIGNSTGNDKNFFVKVSGGTTSCNVIAFPLASAGLAGNDEGVLNRAYSAALTAFTTGSKVVITNYDDNSCNGASKIKLTK